MNESLKEAMALAMPDGIPDHRDALMRPKTTDSKPPHPVGTVLKGVRDPVREQEKRRKNEALKPLI